MINDFGDLPIDSDIEKYWHQVEWSTKEIFNEDPENLKKFRKAFDSYSLDMKLTTMHEHPVYLAADLLGSIGISKGNIETFNERFYQNNIIEDDASMQGNNSGSGRDKSFDISRIFTSFPILTSIVAGSVLAFYFRSWDLLSISIALGALYATSTRSH